MRKQSGVYRWFACSVIWGSLALMGCDKGPDESPADLSVSLGDGSFPGNDGSSPSNDGSSPSNDGSSPVSDGSSPSSDASSPVSDASVSPPDFSGIPCSGQTGSGPVVVSGQTRVRMLSPRLAYDGTSTMAIWSLYPTNGYQRSVWARLQNGAVVDSGDLDLPTYDTSNAQLLTFASRFHLFRANTAPLFRFDGTAWSPVPSFQGDTIAVSGGRMIGIGDNATNSGTEVVFYDGTTVTAPAKISNYGFGAVVSDGANGFAVITTERPDSSHTTLRFLTHDGTAWSPETIIGTFSGGASTFRLNLVRSGSLYCVAFGTNGTDAVAAVLQGGTWTTTTFTREIFSSLIAAQGGLFALRTSDTEIIVYDGGTWTVSPVTGGVLAGFGNRFVYIGGGTFSLFAQLYENGAWGAPMTLLNQGPGNYRVEANDSKVVVTYGRTTLGVITYENNAWTTPFTLTTNGLVSTTVLPIAVIEGNDIATIYPNPGSMRSRSRLGGTWGQDAVLPTTPTTGYVQSAALARNANGQAIAAFSQWDTDQLLFLVSQFDGCRWSTPAAVPGLTPEPQFAVATNSAYIAGSGSRWGRWTGSGLSTPQSFLGSVSPRIASEGTTFVAVWAQNGAIMSATSTDGVTWTTPIEVEAGPGWTLSEVRGGPAGVIVVSDKSGTPPPVSARVWKNGVWSIATSGAVGSCRSAVGNTSALAVCSSTGSVVGQLYSGGVWSSIPLPTTGSGQFTVGTDGVDYRTDYGLPSTPRSTVLQGGVWSTPVTNTIPGFYNLIGLTGNAGVWTLLFTGPRLYLYAARASGSAGYPAAPVVTDTVYNILGTGVGQGPGSSGFWVSFPPAPNSTSSLYVDLGL